MSYALQLLRELASIPVYLVSRLVPRRPKRWVFGAWHGARYADNARYLFEYVSSALPEIEAIWIAGTDEAFAHACASGGKVRLRRSLAGLWCAATASACFITHGPGDVCGPLLNGALVVNLTHGTPLKRIGDDKRSRRFGAFTRQFDRWVRPLLPSYRPASTVLVASEYAVDRFVSAFGLPREKVTATGYPRWRPLRSEAVDARVKALQERMGAMSKVVLYAPTQRMAGRANLSVMDIPGFDAFLSWLEQIDAVLLIRPHFSLSLVGESNLLAAGRGRIHFAHQADIPDANELLRIADVLVSDYSSIIFDYALLARPVVMFAHDLEHYSNQDVGIYGNYQREFAGMIARDWSGVAQVADALASTKAGHATMERFCGTHASLADGSECARIVRLVAEKLRMSKVAHT